MSLKDFSLDAVCDKTLSRIRCVINLNVTYG